MATGGAVAVTLNDLETAISNVLNLPGIPAVLQLNSVTREHAFEAYLFSLVVRAVREAGGTAQICGRQSGADPATVVFRGNHGPLGSNAQDFAYASARLAIGNSRFTLMFSTKGHRVRFTRLMSRSTITMLPKVSDFSNLTHCAVQKESSWGNRVQVIRLHSGGYARPNFHGACGRLWDTVFQSIRHQRPLRRAGKILQAPRPTRPLFWLVSNRSRRGGWICESSEADAPQVVCDRLIDLISKRSPCQ